MTRKTKAPAKAAGPRTMPDDIRRAILIDLGCRVKAAEDSARQEALKAIVGDLDDAARKKVVEGVWLHWAAVQAYLGAQRAVNDAAWHLLTED